MADYNEIGEKLNDASEKMRKQKEKINLTYSLAFYTFEMCIWGFVTTIKIKGLTKGFSRRRVRF